MSLSDKIICRHSPFPKLYMDNVQKAVKELKERLKNEEGVRGIYQILEEVFGEDLI